MTISLEGAAAPVSARALAVAAAVSIALFYSTQSGSLLRPMLAEAPLSSAPYLRAALTSLSDAVVMIALAALAAWRSPFEIIGLAGLAAPIVRPILWALLWLTPALALCLTLASPAEGVSAADVAWLGFGGPATEELVYRGLAVGILVRLCGWRWLTACLLPAVFFGVAHWGQGADPGSILGIVALTGAGGLLFGWLYVRWGFNLWPAMLLHVGLNTLWVVFDLGENALGGALGNAMRIGVVIVAIAGAFWLAPRKGETTD
jgi:uncharacterized protein